MGAVDHLTTQADSAIPEDGAIPEDSTHSAGDRVVHVRYFAGARAAAGLSEERLSLPVASTVADAVAAVAAKHGGRLAKILQVASFLVDGVAVRDPGSTLPADSVLDVLPPFAGG